MEKLPVLLRVFSVEILLCWLLGKIQCPTGRKLLEGFKLEGGSAKPFAVDQLGIK